MLPDRYISPPLARHGVNRVIKVRRVSQQELDEPFYFTPARIAGNFHATVPALSQMV